MKVTLILLSLIYNGVLSEGVTQRTREETPTDDAWHVIINDQTHADFTYTGLLKLRCKPKPGSHQYGIFFMDAANYEFGPLQWDLASNELQYAHSVPREVVVFPVYDVIGVIVQVKQIEPPESFKRDVTKLQYMLSVRFVSPAKSEQYTWLLDEAQEKEVMRIDKVRFTGFHGVGYEYRGQYMTVPYAHQWTVTMDNQIAQFSVEYALELQQHYVIHDGFEDGIEFKDICEGSHYQFRWSGKDKAVLKELSSSIAKTTTLDKKFIEEDGYLTWTFHLAKDGTKLYVSCLSAPQTVAVTWTIPLIGGSEIELVKLAGFDDSVRYKNLPNWENDTLDDTDKCLKPSVPRYGTLRPDSGSYPENARVKLVCGDNRAQLPTDVEELACSKTGEWKMKRKHMVTLVNSQLLDCVGITPGGDWISGHVFKPYGSTSSFTFEVYYGHFTKPEVHLMKGSERFKELEAASTDSTARIDYYNVTGLSEAGHYMIVIVYGKSVDNPAMKASITTEFTLEGQCAEDMVEGYNWPVSDPGVHTLPCHGTTAGEVVRSCAKDYRWTRPSYSTCSTQCRVEARCWMSTSCVDHTSYLNHIMQSITNTTAEDLSHSLATLSPLIHSPSDATLALECVMRMSDVTGYNNLQIESNALTTYDALIQHGVLNPAHLIRVFGEVEKFAQRYSFNTTHQNIFLNHAPSISLQMQSVNSSSFKGQQLQMSNPISVTFPSELEGPAVMVLSVISYQGAFVKDLFSSSDSLSSNVVSVSVRDTEVKGLTEPVTLTLPNPPQGYQVRCVWWGGSAWQDSGCTGTQHSTGYQCSCDHLTNFALMMTPHQKAVDDLSTTLLTVCCLTLSVLGGVATILTIMLIKSLRRSKSSQIHLNLAMAVLGASVASLVSMLAVKSGLPCIITAFLKQFCYLSVMSWSLAEAITMYMAFVTVFGSSSSMWHLCIPAWGAPLCISLLTVLLGKENYNEDFCWLNRNAVWWGFLGFVYGVVLVNSLLFVFILKAVYSTNSSKQPDKTDRIARIRQAAAVMVLLSMGWSAGVLFNSVDVANQAVVSYLFILLNATQGLYIYLLHIASRADVRAQYLRLLGKDITATSSVAGRTTAVTTMALTAASTVMDNNCALEDLASDCAVKSSLEQREEEEEGDDVTLTGDDVETGGTIYTSGGVYAGEMKPCSPSGYRATSMAHGQGIEYFGQDQRENTTVKTTARDENGIIEIQVRKYKEEDIVFTERPSARISRLSDFSRDMCYSEESNSETE